MQSNTTIPFTERDKISDFGLYAYLLDYSGNLNEQILLSYLVAREMHNPSAPTGGLFSIPADDIDGLCDTLGIKVRTLHKAFKKLSKEDKLHLKLNAHGLYARLTDSIRMPGEKDHFVKLPVRREEPVCPEGYCPADDISPEEKKATREYDKAVKEFPEKMARWRLSCFVYDLQGRPYIMYRIVKAMYNEIGGAGAYKKSKVQHKRMKPLNLGAVYGLQGFKMWIGGDDKTLHKDLQSILTARHCNTYPLVWTKPQESSTGHRQQIFTPVPSSYYTKEAWEARNLDITHVDNVCNQIIEQRREEKEKCADARYAVKMQRAEDKAGLNTLENYIQYAIARYCVVTASDNTDCVDSCEPDLFQHPHRYGIPVLGMIFMLSPNMEGESPLYGKMDESIEGCQKQRKLALSLRFQMTGKQRTIWEQEETRDRFALSWAAFIEKIYLEEQKRVKEEQKRVEEERQRVEEEQKRVEEEQKRVEEEQKRVEEAAQRELQVQRCVGLLRLRELKKQSTDSDEVTLICAEIAEQEMKHVLQASNKSCSIEAAKLFFLDLNGKNVTLEDERNAKPLLKAMRALNTDVNTIIKQKQAERQTKLEEAKKQREAKYQLGREEGIQCYAIAQYCCRLKPTREQVLDEHLRYTISHAFRDVCASKGYTFLKIAMEDFRRNVNPQIIKMNYMLKDSDIEEAQELADALNKKLHCVSDENNSVKIK